jgi:hypothetical protein
LFVRDDGVRLRSAAVDSNYDECHSDGNKVVIPSQRILKERSDEGSRSIEGMYRRSSENTAKALAR